VSGYLYILSLISLKIFTAVLIATGSVKVYGNINTAIIQGIMWKKRIIALVLLLAGVGLGFAVYTSEKPGAKFMAKFPFRFGLDIQGGTQLTYQADTKAVAAKDVPETMAALRDVIERRINALGVSEPNVQTETTRSATGDSVQRLIIEFPGLTDVRAATEQIGQTPLLQFKTERPEGPDKEAIKKDRDAVKEVFTKEGVTDAEKQAALTAHPRALEDADFVETRLTGAQLKKAEVVISSSKGNEPTISLSFNDEGQKLFAEITKANVEKRVAIYLDGQPISTPVVREAITDGNAIISGNFTMQEARDLKGRLNSGAIPVPITLVSTQTIGATLGQDALKSGVHAGLIGILLVAFFLIMWYRVPGIIASLAMGIYVALMLTVFKLIPVTLTAAGIAGFLLSVGMAVDANILIFERMKEEMKKGKELGDAMHDGFTRAWTSIRDSNISSLISASILFWFGTSVVKGFALTLGLGVLLSLFTAITVSRSFLYALGASGKSKLVHFLFGGGFTK
jgi:protein-export membrane protein SecD